MLNPLLNRQRVWLLVVIFSLLCSVYLVPYSGAVESSDSWRALDAVSSFVDYGDFLLDQASIYFLTQTFDDSLRYPLQTAGVEPLQVALSAPLYVLARLVPGIGLFHTLYLFNIIVTALAGCVLFLYALALGYDERTAALGVLIFGFGTAVFPYTKSFFREPLLLLMLLTAALLIERFRAGGYRSWRLLFGVLLCLLGVLLTKASALLALPALLLLAFPAFRRGALPRAALTFVLVIGLVAGMFVLLSSTSVFGSRYNLLLLLDPRLAAYFVPALQAYLLSLGGSIWGTSPVVLLALPGLWLLLRRGLWRYVLAVPLLLVAFAVGYAALNGAHWFGGLSWPPRFLLPVLPFLILAALPVVERIRKYPLWALLGIALFAYSLWVQLSGVTISWSEYPRLLPPEAGGLIEWQPGLNDPAYLRWTLIPRLWGTIPYDIAWMIIGMPGLLLAFAALGIAALGALIVGLRRTQRRLRSALLFPVLLLVTLGVGLHLLYASDPRYLSRDDTLYAMLPVLEAQTEPSDIILLSSPRYTPFFSNSGKLNGAGRVVSLPLQPGEQPSPEQEPRVRSDNPMVLLTKDTVRLLYNLAASHDRLWLLVNAGPALPWSVRPVERFMAEHFYPVGAPLETGPATRLIEFSTISAPDRFAFRSPEHDSDLAFGDHIRLTGFELPAGTAYQSGDVLALTTDWTTDTPLEANYSMGVYLRTADGGEVAQVDSQPGAGFFPTSLWQPGIAVRDNRAFRLSGDLAPGEYQLWVKLYDFGAGGEVQDLPVTAGERIDNVIGVLPVTIRIGEDSIQ